MRKDNNTKNDRCDTNCTCYTCILNHWKNSCDYGKPDGEDSWDETCVCGDE